jgi:nicotinamidase-related amidase
VEVDTALIVIDMLNPYDHEHAEILVESVEAMVTPLAGLIEDAKHADGVDLIYVNDNYEDFTATSEDLVRRALNGERPDLVEPIVPPDDVEFLQKVRHSAFYSTALDHLLRERTISTIVLAGQVTEQCILYTALDAYVRGFDIRVPVDAVAHIDEELGASALRMMERNMRVDIREAADCLGRAAGRRGSSH